tara:strand:+ start:2797 stop:3513 length:717 start_codon:yes stop_codon:yes gene_type:complete
MVEVGMANNFKLREFNSTDELDKNLSKYIERILKQSLQDDFQTSLVMSGGSTPKGLFQLLSNTKLDWSNILVTLADDRWVDVSHKDSNERLIKDLMLINHAENAKFVSLKTACTSASDGAMELECSFPKISSFSLVTLGMGADGHTASLFPNTNSLQQGIDLNCSQQFIASMPNDAPHMRISMTASRLLAADEIIIHIVGDKKREVLDKASAATDTNELPVRVILNQTRVPVTVFWSP